MIQSMYNGVSGLKAQNTALDVISNNIANVNTVGYKSSSVSFQEMLSQTLQGATAPSSTTGGADPVQTGLGVSVGSIKTDQTDGSLESTGNASDVAIQGNGYLVLGDGVGKYYTRNGELKLDGSDKLVASASKMTVLGWTADAATGMIDNTQPITATSTISIPMGQLSVARQTSIAKFSGNLDSTAKAGDKTSVNAEIYDSLGQSHTATITFSKVGAISAGGYAATTSTVGTGDMEITVGGTTNTISLDSSNNTLSGVADAINAANIGVTATVVQADDGTYSLKFSSDKGDVSVDTSDLVAGSGTVPAFSTVSDAEWNWVASSDDALTGTNLGTGTVDFDEDGKIRQGDFNISLTLADAAGATNPVDMTVNFSSISQLSGTSSLTAASQDGLPYGTLNGYTIGSDGVITGTFTNGMSQPIAQIAMAQFTNPSGLSKEGNSVLAETPNSGLPQIGVAGEGSMGSLTSGSLEGSNVDLATEFANMIVAQRGFQANSKVITTANQILEDLVSLVR